MPSTSPTRNPVELQIVISRELTELLVSTETVIDSLVSEPLALGDPGRHFGVARRQTGDSGETRQETATAASAAAHSAPSSHTPPGSPPSYLRAFTRLPERGYFVADLLSSSHGPVKPSLRAGSQRRRWCVRPRAQHGIRVPTAAPASTCGAARSRPRSRAGSPRRRFSVRLWEAEEDPARRPLSGSRAPVHTGAGLWAPLVHR